MAVFAHVKAHGWAGNVRKALGLASPFQQQRFRRKNSRRNHTKPIKTMKKDYSYRIASIGSRLEAFRAGYQPKKIPMTVQTRKESTMLQTCMRIG